MAIKKDDDGNLFNDGEPLKYKSNADFGPYNEPSWVPEGKCKCCATVTDQLTNQTRRKTPAELCDVTVIAHTLNKNLEVRTCAFCDAPPA